MSGSEQHSAKPVGNAAKKVHHAATHRTTRTFPRDGDDTGIERVDSERRDTEPAHNSDRAVRRRATARSPRSLPDRGVVNFAIHEVLTSNGGDRRHEHGEQQDDEIVEHPRDLAAAGTELLARFLFIFVPGITRGAQQNLSDIRGTAAAFYSSR